MISSTFLSLNFKTTPDPAQFISLDWWNGSRDVLGICFFHLFVFGVVVDAITLVFEIFLFKLLISLYYKHILVFG